MSSGLKGSLVALALQEVGIREVGGNNLGPRVAEYQKTTWLKPGPWPWCAALMCFLMKNWLTSAEVREALQLGNAKAAEAWRCKDASAFDWEKWAVQKHISIYPETVLAQLGDIVVFDFSHIGLVIEDQEEGSEFIRTIEGNTNGKGDRDSVSGDGVWQKTRRHELTKSYIRIIE